MTDNKQHIKNLKKLKSFHNGSYGADIDRAIKALEQEPFINKPCVSSGVCENDKNKVLDKIRAEIMSKDGLEEALEIIDKYNRK